MEYRKLGNTDIELSVICLGTMTWGQQNTEKEAHLQMDYAITQGINFFDTAELYPVPARSKTQGRTEAYIGTWFKKNKQRKEIFLASKIAGPGPYTAHIREDKDFSRKSIAEAVEGSLRRLQTDYIDLYQIHWPARLTNYFGRQNYKHREGWEDNFHEILGGIEEQISAGKVRYFGISNETPWGLKNYMGVAQAHGLPRCMSVQNPYSLLNRLYEIGLAEMSVRDKVGLLAYSPTAFGLLSGKFHDGTARDDCRIKQFPQMSRYNGQKSYEAAGKYIEIARRYGYDPAQMALAFVNQQAFVTSNIIGATSMEQLQSNISSIDISLTKDCLKEIDEIHQSIPNPAP